MIKKRAALPKMENEWHRCLLLYFRRSWEKGMWLGSSLKLQWSKRKVSWGMAYPKSHGSRLWEKNMGLIGAHRQVPHLYGGISLSNSTFLQEILQVLWNKASHRWIMRFPKQQKFLKELDILAYRSMGFFAIMLCSLINKNVAFLCVRVCREGSLCFK